MSAENSIEISATSAESFEDAIRLGIATASQTVSHVKAAWVAGRVVTVQNGKINGYRVDMRVTFDCD